MILAASMAVASAQLYAPAARGYVSPYGLAARGPIGAAPAYGGYGLPAYGGAYGLATPAYGYAPQYAAAPVRYAAPAAAPVRVAAPAVVAAPVAPMDPVKSIAGLDSLIMYKLLNKDNAEYELTGTVGAPTSVKKQDDDMMMMMMMSGVGVSGANGMNNYLLYSLLDDKDDTDKYVKTTETGDFTLDGTNYKKSESNKNNLMLMLFGGIGSDMGGIGQDAMLPLLLSGSGTDGKDMTSMLMLMSTLNGGLF